MKNLHVKQRETNNNTFDFDLTELATVIASTVATVIAITTLRLLPFTPLDIKAYLQSITTQFIYTTYVLPLLNTSKIFVSISNTKLNPTIYAVLYTQLLTKTISNLTIRILNLESTSKSGVEILLLLKTKISML